MMNKRTLSAIVLTAFSGLAFSENEVTVDPTTLRLTIPTVIYQGSSYSARLGFNGSCFVVEDLTPKASQTLLTHEGFDFSAGAAPANWDLTDGYITVWTPKDYPSGYAYGSGFWWSPYDSTGSETPIKDMGEVALSSVTSVPTDWTYISGSGVYPLMANHVYVVKARDGYAKFKVISLSGMEYAVDNNWDPSRWQVTVEFGYTAGGSF